MNDCPNGAVRDLLPELLHGRLSAAARLVVEAHLGDCADCRGELALLRSMRSSMRRTTSVDTARIVSAIPSYRAPARRSRAWWRAAAAIAVLIAGGASVSVLQRESQLSADGTAVAARNAPVTPAVGESAAAAPLQVASAESIRELALGSSAVGDLDDDQLSALLADLDDVEVVPSAEVENGPGDDVASTPAER